MKKIKYARKKQKKQIKRIKFEYKDAFSFLRMMVY